MPNKAIFRSAIEHLISPDSCQLERRVGSGSNGAIWDLIACSWENFGLGKWFFFFLKKHFRQINLLVWFWALARLGTHSRVLNRQNGSSPLLGQHTNDKFFFFFSSQVPRDGGPVRPAIFFPLSLLPGGRRGISKRITDHNMIFVWSAAVHLPQQTTAQQVQIKRGTIAGVQGRAKCADPCWIPREERAGPRGVGQKPFLLRGVTTRII